MKPTESHSDAFNAEWFLIGAILVFGINFPLLKVVSLELSAFSTNALRFTLAAIVLGTLIGADLWQSFLQLKDYWMELVLLASMGYLLSPLFLVYGLQYSTASNAALILAAAPVWTAILSWSLGNDVIGGLGWSGLAVSTLGLIIITAPVTEVASSSQSTLFGDLLFVADSIIWGSYVSLQRNLLERSDPLENSFWSLIVVLPLLYAVAMTQIEVQDILNLSTIAWVALLFSGIFSMGLAHVWWNQSLIAYGPTTVSIYGNGIPVVAVLVGWGMFNEFLTIRHVVGGVVVLAGVGLSRYSRIQKGGKEVGPPES